MKRSNKKLLGLASLLAGTVLALGCAEPISGNLNTSCAAGTNCSSGDPINPDDPAPVMDPIHGEVIEGLYKSERVVEIDPETMMLSLRLPFPAMALVPGLMIEAEVPGLPGAKVEVLQTVGLTSGLVLHLPLEYVLGEIDVREGSKLPSGAPLPIIPGGELPAFAVALHPTEDVEVIVYVGPEAIGLLYWSSFNPYIKLSYPIFTEDYKHPLGYLHTLPHLKNTNGQVIYPKGGFLVGVSLPIELRRQLADLF